MPGKAGSVPAHATLQHSALALNIWTFAESNVRPEMQATGSVPGMHCRYSSLLGSNWQPLQSLAHLAMDVGCRCRSVAGYLQGCC